MKKLLHARTTYHVTMEMSQMYIIHNTSNLNEGHHTCLIASVIHLVTLI